MVRKLCLIMAWSTENGDSIAYHDGNFTSTRILGSLQGCQHCRGMGLRKADSTVLSVLPGTVDDGLTPLGPLDVPGNSHLHLRIILE